MRLRPFQTRERIRTIRIHRTAKQKIRVPRANVSDEFIRHINFTTVRVEISIRINDAIERE